MHLVETQTMEKDGELVVITKYPLFHRLNVEYHLSSMPRGGLGEYKHRKFSCFTGKNGQPIAWTARGSGYDEDGTWRCADYKFSGEETVKSISVILARFQKVA